MIIKPIMEFGDWAVTKYGLEHLGHPEYPIHRSRLWEPDWESHMEDKNWVIIYYFKKALFEAKKYHGGKNG